MHGIVRLTTYLDGEQMLEWCQRSATCTGFEKSLKFKWIQVIPYTDRLEAVSPVLKTSATQWLLRSYSVLKFQGEHSLPGDHG